MKVHFELFWRGCAKIFMESFELRVNYSNLPLCGEKFKGEWE
jgi:hypothetical protein